MNTKLFEIESKVDDLLIVLDKDIEQIKKNLDILDQLRCMVVKQDESSLRELLENTQSRSNSYKENELKRQALRKDLAFALGCDTEQITLSRLSEQLAGDRKVRIAEKKAQLQTLTNELMKEHLATSMLLADCARFNRAMLNGIFALAQTGSTTYTPTGSTVRPTGTAFVDLQF
ncbi:flagellar export chaperone FlgN [Planctomycetota bacterium]